MFLLRMMKRMLLLLLLQNFGKKYYLSSCYQFYFYCHLIAIKINLICYSHLQIVKVGFNFKIVHFLIMIMIIIAISLEILIRVMRVDYLNRMATKNYFHMTNVIVSIAGKSTNYESLLIIDATHYYCLMRNYLDINLKYIIIVVVVVIATAIIVMIVAIIMIVVTTIAMIIIIIFMDLTLLFLLQFKN